jgi:hypothetical protein
LGDLHAQLGQGKEEIKKEGLYRAKLFFQSAHGGVGMLALREGGARDVKHIGIFQVILVQCIVQTVAYLAQARAKKGVLQAKIDHTAPPGQKTTDTRLL